MGLSLGSTIEENLRRVFGEVLSYGEVLLYIAFGIILLAGAFVGIAGSCVGLQPHEYRTKRFRALALGCRF